jgi:hypothetical protein
VQPVNLTAAKLAQTRRPAQGAAGESEDLDVVDVDDLKYD